MVLEFKKIRFLGVKITYSLFASLAIHLNRSYVNSAHIVNTMHPGIDHNMKGKFTIRWVPAFSDRFQIVHRSLSGNFTVRSANQVVIQRSVAISSEMPHHQFNSGDLDEDTVKDADDTHVIIICTA